MIVKAFYTGPLDVNCYVVSDEKTKKAFMVDPGGYSLAMTNYIDSNELKLEFIVLTHGHGDHIGGVEEYKKLYNIPVYAHEAEAVVLSDANQNFSRGVLGKNVMFHADKWLKDNEEISFSGDIIKIIHTPGHSPGGISILIGKNLFCGDTLFQGSIGRSDFPHSSTKDLFESIRNKLFILDDDIVAYPGHGESTTIGFEKQYNPFF